MNQMNKMRVLISVVVLVIMAGFGFLIGSKANDGGASKTAELQGVSTAYISALTSGDADKAYDLSSEVMQGRNKIQSVKEFSDRVKSDKAEIKNPELYIKSDKKANQAIYLATVTNLPKSEMGRTEANFVIRLIYEDGSWKIDSSQMY